MNRTSTRTTTWPPSNDNGRPNPAHGAWAMEDCAPPSTAQKSKARLVRLGLNTPETSTATQSIRFSSPEMNIAMSRCERTQGSVLESRYSPRNYLIIFPAIDRQDFAIGIRLSPPGLCTLSLHWMLQTASRNERSGLSCLPKPYPTITNIRQCSTHSRKVCSSRACSLRDLSSHNPLWPPRCGVGRLKSEEV